MKKIIIIVILSLYFTTQSKADDIRDFAIEGISIGDSLLNYFSKKNIEKEMRSEFSYKYKDNRYVGLGVGQTEQFSLFKKLDQFDEVGVTINPNDKNYIVQGLSGEILCFNDIDKCMVSKDKIINDLKNSFAKINIDSWKRKHPSDKTGKSIVYGNDLKISNLDFTISVSVYDMSDDAFNDSVKVSIKNKEFDNFITYEAYK